MEMTPELAELVLKDLSESKINQEAKRQGMITMRQDGVIKALAGVTTISELHGKLKVRTALTRVHNRY